MKCVLNWIKLGKRHLVKVRTKANIKIWRLRRLDFTTMTRNPYLKMSYDLQLGRCFQQVMQYWINHFNLKTSNNKHILIQLNNKSSLYCYYFLGVHSPNPAELEQMISHGYKIAVFPKPAFVVTGTGIHF